MGAFEFVELRSERGAGRNNLPRLLDWESVLIDTSETASFECGFINLEIPDHSHDLRVNPASVTFGPLKGVVSAVMAKLGIEFERLLSEFVELSCPCLDEWKRKPHSGRWSLGP